MVKNILFSIILVYLGLIVSFGQNKTVKFSSEFRSEKSKDFVKKNYYISIPKGFVKDDRQVLTGTSNEEIRFIYKDSSIIYITNDMTSSSLNIKNKIHKGIDTYLESFKRDTFSYNGIQKNGNFWMEKYLGEIIVGYVNCPKEKKEQFDESLKTIRRKKKVNCIQ